jgi:LPS-assembly protein
MQFPRFLLFNIAVALCHLLCGSEVQAQSTLPLAQAAADGAKAVSGVLASPASLAGQGSTPFVFVAESSGPGTGLAATFGPAVCMLPSPALLPVPPLSPLSGQSGSTGQNVSALQTTPLPGTGDEVRFGADKQQKEGSVTHLRGAVEILYRGMVLTADEVDYSDETQVADARGHVHFLDKARDENIYAETGRFNLADDTGQFTKVTGSYGAHIAPGGSKNVYLTTTNPFYFESPVVDRTGANAYVIHDGWVTTCKSPGELWRFQGKETLVRPEEYFVAHGGWMRVKGIPIFYMPYFRHTLQRIPRQSGFLSPHFGTSSIKGIFLGEDYFWAINRSMDLLAGAEFYSARGWAQNAVFRMRGTGDNHLTTYYYGVFDRGPVVDGVRQASQGGRTLSVQGSMDLPDGFRAVANVNYLSSYIFRLAFSQSYNEAIGTEVHSQAFITKHFDDYDFHVAVFRYQDFQSATPDDSIQIRSLPSIQFAGHDRPLFSDLPIYFSFDTALDFLNRSQIGLSTPAFVSRFDAFPRATSPFHFGHWDFVVSFGVRATAYTASVTPGGPGVEHVIGTDRVRTAGEVDLDIRPPALEKIFHSPIKRLGDKWKHTIEPRLTFQYVGGIENPASILLFDDRDIMVNTRAVTLSVTQRLLSKRDKDGVVTELASWEVGQRYYLDPTFDGAITPGQRNVFASTLDLSPYSFIDTARRFSPVYSDLRLNLSHRFDLDSVLQYDFLLHRLTAGSLNVTARRGKIFGTVGHDFSRGDPLIAPNENVVQFRAGYGSSTGLGPNVVWLVVPDLRNSLIQYTAVQASYNTDCCGLLAEWRRSEYGATQPESSWRVAISFANLGSVGNIKKKERMF